MSDFHKRDADVWIYLVLFLVAVLSIVGSVVISVWVTGNTKEEPHGSDHD